METSDVVLAGTVLPGFEPREVAAALAAMAGLSQDKALALVSSGTPRLARRGLSPEAAQALTEKFAAMGVAAFVRTADGATVQPTAPPQTKPSAPPQRTTAAPPASVPESAAPPSAPQANQSANQFASPPPSAVSLGKSEVQPEVAQPSPAVSLNKEEDEAGADRSPEPAKKFCHECGATISARAEICPTCGVRQWDQQDEEDRDFNPYTAPQADLSQTGTQQGSYWRETCVVVPAARGIQWIKEAWAMIRSAPGTWIGALLLVWVCLGMVGALTFGLGMIAGPLGPIVGNLAATLCGPFFAGGLALLAHRQTEQEAFGVSDVFAAFQTCPDRILLLAVLEVAYSIAVTTVLGIGGALFAALLPILSLFLIPLGAVLYLPLITATCMAPTLVAVAGQRPAQSIWQSFLSTCKNWLPVLLNGLVFCGIPALLSILAVLLVSIRASGGNEEAAADAIFGIFVVAALLIFLACLPLFVLGPAVIYLAVRDMFYEAGKEGDSSASTVNQAS